MALRLRLNYDVLLSVLQVQDIDSTAEVVAMMQTCRTLRVYEAGVPLLLAPGVTIRRVRCLASFWAFMLADATRFRYIRCLRLDHWDRFPRSKRLGQALAYVLQHAYSLEELALSHSEFLNRYPKVANAIVTMTSLKTFSLLHDDCMSPQRLVDMLRKMKSPRPKIPCLSLDFSSATSAARCMKITRNRYKCWKECRSI